VYNTQTVHCSDRFNVLRVSTFLIINAYFPCVGIAHRQIICDDLLADIGAWCDQYCALRHASRLKLCDQRLASRRIAVIFVTLKLLSKWQKLKVEWKWCLTDCSNQQRSPQTGHLTPGQTAADYESVESSRTDVVFYDHVQQNTQLPPVIRNLSVDGDYEKPYDYVH